MNPLNSMTWEERFQAAWQALVEMERQYEEAANELRAERKSNEARRLIQASRFHGGFSPKR
jgi:hypothetical protein